MTTDERLERLLERHEALTQSVELMRLESQERASAQDKRIDKILVALEKDGENIRGLARIAEIHEHRISELENGGDGG
jgi:hypothetical protein